MKEALVGGIAKAQPQDLGRRPETRRHLRKIFVLGHNDVGAAFRRRPDFLILRVSQRQLTNGRRLVAPRAFIKSASAGGSCASMRNRTACYRLPTSTG